MTDLHCYLQAYHSVFGWHTLRTGPLSDLTIRMQARPRHRMMLPWRIMRGADVIALDPGRDAYHGPEPVHQPVHLDTTDPQPDAA